MCPVVVGELFAGFRKGSRESYNRTVFQKFLATPRVTVLAISIETAEFYCLIFEQLRSQGTPIPVNDIWIAACGMEHGAHLATMDNHFKQITGLLSVYPNA